MTKLRLSIRIQVKFAYFLIFAFAFKVIATRFYVAWNTYIDENIYLALGFTSTTVQFNNEIMTSNEWCCGVTFRHTTNVRRFGSAQYSTHTHSQIHVLFNKYMVQLEPIVSIITSFWTNHKPTLRLRVYSNTFILCCWCKTHIFRLCTMFVYWTTVICAVFLCYCIRTDYWRWIIRFPRIVLFSPLKRCGRSMTTYNHFFHPVSLAKHTTLPFNNFIFAFWFYQTIFCFVSPVECLFLVLLIQSCLVEVNSKRNKSQNKKKLSTYRTC